MKPLSTSKDTDEVTTELPVVFKKPEETPDPETPEVALPQLAQHDIDIPEEPENVHLITHVWNTATQQFDEVDQGEQLLVPTGCCEADEVSPYENTVTFKSALPRDKAQDANLYSTYRAMQIVSRRWVQKHVDEDIDPTREDRDIEDDIPVMLAALGKPGGDAPPGASPVGGTQPGEQAPKAPGVAQTPGLTGALGTGKPTTGAF